MTKHNSGEPPRSTAGGDAVQLRDYQRGVPSDGDDTRGHAGELTSRRFDEMVVQSRVTRRSKFHRPENVGQRLWRCRCDCGATLLRTTAWIYARVRQQRPLACTTCLAELRGGKATQRNEWKAVVWAELWERHGTLYSRGASDGIARDVMEKLEAEHGPRVEWELEREAARVVWGIAEEPWVAPKNPEHCQQEAYLYRLSPEPDPDPRYMKVFVCLECRAKAEIAYGCVRCMEPICVPCVDAERHGCPARFGPEYSLEEVGKALNVSRERARQIQDRALRQIREQLRDDAGEMRAVWWTGKKPILKPDPVVTPAAPKLTAKQKKARLRKITERTRVDRWRRARLALAEAFGQVGLAVEMWNAQHNHLPPACPRAARCARQNTDVALRDSNDPNAAVLVWSPVTVAPSPPRPPPQREFDWRVWRAAQACLPVSARNPSLRPCACGSGRAFIDCHGDEGDADG